MNWIIALSVSLVIFGLNLIFTPLILKFSHRRNWLDQPNHRTVHQNPTPRLGGVGMFASAAIVFLLLFLLDLCGIPLLPPGTWTFPVALIFLGWAATHVLGVLDDFIQFRAIYKFALQMTGIFLVLGSGLMIDRIYIPGTNLVLNFGIFAPFITLLWIAGVTNAVNLIDGMDGLAGGYSILALTALGIYTWLTGQALASIVCWGVVGSILAFMVFNFPPAKIFMGDSGSLMLGFLLAVMPLAGGDKSLFHNFWLLPIILVLYPVSDTLAAIIRRLREGRPIWSADKAHTHHKLLALGVRPRWILGLVYLTTVFTCIPIAVAGLTWNVADSRIFSWVGSAVAGLLMLTLFTILHYSYHIYYVRNSQPPRT